MLRAAVRIGEIILLALAGYNLLTALFGWRDPSPASIGERRRRFRVVIPAHNEEQVVAAVCGDLGGMDYPSELVETWVVADRCTDQTGEIASENGARVAVRSEGQEGKGAALGWYLEQHPLNDDEALVVLDADNRVPSNMLARFADELDAGHQVLQAYLDAANPDQSGLATASALSYWASNRMVQLARHNMGWSADLGGTGMCFTAAALAAAGGFGTELVEDQALGARLLLSGHRVVWLHDVKVADEKPAGPSVAIRQRGRWAAGRRAVARRYFWPLVRAGKPVSWDMALRLVQPSRMGVASLSALLALCSALGVPLLPWPVWPAAAAVQFLAPLAFLARERVPGRYLLAYPLLILLPLSKIPSRLMRQRGWYHTPHEGAVKED
jgi:cellulose synthase/poly-beta-1,6-N-acetylglucosamine synthase-like glycosyltransferase